MKMDKKLSASGSFAPLALTRDSAPGPRWGSAVAPPLQASLRAR